MSTRPDIRSPRGNRISPHQNRGRTHRGEYDASTTSRTGTSPPGGDERTSDSSSTGTAVVLPPACTHPAKEHDVQLLSARRVGRRGNPPFEIPAPNQRRRGMKTAASRCKPARGWNTPGPDPDGASCSEFDHCEEGWKSWSYVWKGPRLDGRGTCSESTTFESTPGPRPGPRARSTSRTRGFPISPGEQPGGSRDQRHPPKPEFEPRQKPTPE